MSGLPHTMVSNSNPVKSDKSGTGTTRDMPSRTAEAAGSTREVGTVWPAVRIRGDFQRLHASI